MGRKKKYSTSEEIRIAKRKQWMKYYLKNKESINVRRMKKYYEQKKSLHI
jgi:hypothetical protein